MAENATRKLFTTAAAADFFGLDALKYDDIAMWLVTELHPDGFRCPHCSADILPGQNQRYLTLGRIKCHSCGKKFTALVGTLLNTSKLEVREVYLIAVLTELGVPVKRIAAQLKVHPDTVLNWQSHFQAQQDLDQANRSEVIA